VAPSPSTVLAEPATAFLITRAIIFIVAQAFYLPHNALLILWHFFRSIPDFVIHSMVPFRLFSYVKTGHSQPDRGLSASSSPFWIVNLEVIPVMLEVRHSMQALGSLKMSFKLLDGGRLRHGRTIFVTTLPFVQNFNLPPSGFAGNYYHIILLASIFCTTTIPSYIIISIIYPIAHPQLINLEPAFGASVCATHGLISVNRGWSNGRFQG
jgi:hypothetical protein